MGITQKLILISVCLSFFMIVRGQDDNAQIIRGHEYVDLGLSVYWATCNIGSNSPEGYGDYFAWGETYSKSCYNRMTYKYSGEKDDFEDYTKYLGENNKLVSEDSRLVETDDVATVQWGTPWRMPKKEEIDELVDSCSWVYDEINGNKGYWAISKINSNKIYFPLAGYIYNDILSGVGKIGKYWASELRSDMCFEAYQLWISHDDNWAKMMKKEVVFLSDDGLRVNGRTVRAVCSRNQN